MRIVRKNRVIKQDNPEDPTSFWKVVRKLKCLEKKPAMAQKIGKTFRFFVVALSFGPLLAFSLSISIFVPLSRMRLGLLGCFVL